MVHANVEIAGFENLSRPFKISNFSMPSGNARRRNLLLSLTRQRSVAEKSDAIRREANDLIDGVGKRAAV